MRRAYEVELIQGDIWLEMLKVRNELKHDYDGEMVKKACDKMIGVYLDKFYEFQKTVEKLLKPEADQIQ